MPLVTDTLAIKLDALTLNREGYVTRLRDGADINRVERQGYRGSLLWQIAPSVTFYLTGDYSRDRSGQTAPAPLTIPPAGVGDVLPGNRQPLFGYYVSDPDKPDLYNYDGGGGSASLTVDTGIGQIKSVSAYRKFHNVFWSDLRHVRWRHQSQSRPTPKSIYAGTATRLGRTRRVQLRRRCLLSSGAYPKPRHLPA